MIQLCFKLQNIFLQFLLFFLISFSNYKTVGTEQYAQQKYGKLLFSLISLLAIFFFTCDYYTAIDFIWSVKNGYSYIITFHWIRQYFWGLLLSSYFRVSSHIPPAFYCIKKKKKKEETTGEVQVQMKIFHKFQGQDFIPSVWLPSQEVLLSVNYMFQYYKRHSWWE